MTYYINNSGDIYTKILNPTNIKRTWTIQDREILFLKFWLPKLLPNINIDNPDISTIMQMQDKLLIPNNGFDGFWYKSEFYSTLSYIIGKINLSKALHPPINIYINSCRTPFPLLDNYYNQTDNDWPEFTKSFDKHLLEYNANSFT